MENSARNRKHRINRKIPRKKNLKEDKKSGTQILVIIMVAAVSYFITYVVMTQSMNYIEYSWKDLVVEFFKRTDLVNINFSLALSVLLENIISDEDNVSKSRAGIIFATIAGAILYIAFSFNDNSSVFTVLESQKLGLNIIYMVLTIMTIIFTIVKNSK